MRRSIDTDRLPCFAPRIKCAHVQYQHLLTRPLPAAKASFVSRPVGFLVLFLMPGGRLKLDSRDLYALGAHRGGIDERWFSSTTHAANGPGTPEDEGLSYIDLNGKKVLLKEAIEVRGRPIPGGRSHAARWRMEHALQVLR